MVPEDRQRRWRAREPLIVGPPMDGVGTSQAHRVTDEREDEPALQARRLKDLLEQRENEFATLLHLTERINYGVTLEEILEYVYEELRAVIPYNRIGS